MSLSARSKLTVAEYLEVESGAATKSEFFDGEMWAMAGGSLTHAEICMNLTRAVANALAARPCRPYGSDLKVYSLETNSFFYPDLSVICGKPEFLPDRTDAVLNPSAIFEVLSPSTEARDRGVKFEAYRTMPSLTDYVLIAQDRPLVEHFTRRPDGWLLVAYTALENAVELDSIEVAVTLSELYAKVDFSLAETETGSEA
jgi:Uma2 family endonuclease